MADPSFLISYYYSRGKGCPQERIFLMDVQISRRKLSKMTEFFGGISRGLHDSENRCSRGLLGDF